VRQQARLIAISDPLSFVYMQLLREVCVTDQRGCDTRVSLMHPLHFNSRLLPFRAPLPVSPAPHPVVEECDCLLNPATLFITASTSILVIAPLINSRILRRAERSADSRG